MKCVGCGCTDERACDGECSWAMDGICTRCISIYSRVNEHLILLARDQLRVAQKVKGVK
jgi:hypothetical protein